MSNGTRAWLRISTDELCLNGVCTKALTASGSGTVSTSSPETSGRVPFWTTTGANTALLSGGSASFTWNNTTSLLTAANFSATNASTTKSLYVGGNVGTSSTSPSAKLTVAGGDIHVGGVVTSTSTTSSSTLQNLTTTNFITTTFGITGTGTTTNAGDLSVNDLRATGKFYDINSRPGTSGQVLSSTGTGIDWIDASSQASTTRYTTAGRPAQGSRSQ